MTRRRFPRDFTEALLGALALALFILTLLLWGEVFGY